MKFAIWAAVSTAEQAAADKVSLSEQVERCRAVATSKGWVESVPPYIVAGESRTKHVNLRDAEIAIPELHQMLDDAQEKRYNVLVMVDFNRLRDLLDPVAKTLSHYGCQMFSLAQPVDPLPPETYSPYDSDAAPMMQGLAKIISQAQISDLRRKYRTAMPRRVTSRGLPIQIPWGYRKPPGRELDRNAVPVQETDKCAVLIAAKDAILAGKTLSQIVPLFEKYPPPGGGKKWYRQTVHGMMTNPFYAGIVQFGLSRAVLDPRTGQVSRDRRHPERAVQGEGRHTPLWDDDTYAAIVAELKRHTRGHVGRRNNQFTGLLRCGECGAHLWIFYNANWGERLPENRVWRCSTREPHVTVKHDRLVELVGDNLINDVKNLLVNPSTDSTISQVDTEPQRKRLIDAYQAGLMSYDEFSGRIAELDAIDRKQADTTRQDKEREARLARLKELESSISTIADYIRDAPPQEVNSTLRQICESITVHDDSNITIKYKP